MAQEATVLAAKPDDLSSCLRVTWWKERTDSTDLPSDSHMHTVACNPPHRHTK